eukprot:CAMPEP_0185040888 /NCGR_PEP_ID=MMETSP1103-20130426/39521_1 /TAXON_ID=36769 /ORGANISM="Paraphysomonas bandaiensis, Strain Caron Lab Isolate" /LENGTH=718 /DNA_ID=CAMNT_0027580387 /DNA_START=228 /DNA_END=2384 /DNA_ORIENTATION=-
MYARLLLDTVFKAVSESAKWFPEPFNILPPDGPLPAFPTHLKLKLKNTIGTHESYFWRDLYDRLIPPADEPSNAELKFQLEEKERAHLELQNRLSLLECTLKKISVGADLDESIESKGNFAEQSAWLDTTMNLYEEYKKLYDSLDSRVQLAELLNPDDVSFVSDKIQVNRLQSRQREGVIRELTARLEEAGRTLEEEVAARGAEYRETIDYLQFKIGAAEQERDDALKRLEKECNENISLRKEIEDNTRSIKQQCDEIEDLQRVLRAVDSERAEAISCCELLASEFKDAQARSEKLSAQANENTDKIATLEEKLRVSEVELAETRREVADRERNGASLRNQCDELCGTVERLVEENKQLHATVMDLKSEANVTASRCGDLEEEKAVLISRYEELVSELEVKEQAFCTQLRSTETAKEELFSRNCKLMRGIEESQGHLREMEIKLKRESGEKEELENEVASLKRDVGRLEVDIKRVVSLGENKASMINDLERKVEHQEAEITDLRREATLLKGDVSTLENEVDDLVSQGRTKNSRIHELEAKLKRAEVEASEMRRETALLKGQKHALEEEVKRLFSAGEVKNSHVRDLESAVQHAEREKTVLRHEICSLMDQIDAMRDDTSRLMSLRDTKDNTIGSLERSLDTAIEEREQIEVDNKHLRADINRLEDINQKLKSDLSLSKHREQLLLEEMHRIKGAKDNAARYTEDLLVYVLDKMDIPG